MKLPIIVFSVILALFIAGCESDDDDATTPPLIGEEDQRDLIVESSPSSPISVKMTVAGFDGKPVLGSETDITVTISSLDGNSYESTNAQIETEEGIKVIGGDKEWTGTASENPSTFIARVKIDKIGEWTLTASARHVTGPDSWLGGAARVCFTVTEESISMESGICEVGPDSNLGERVPDDQVPPTEPDEGIKPGLFPDEPIGEDDPFTAT